MINTIKDGKIMLVDPTMMPGMMEAPPAADVTGGDGDTSEASSGETADTGATGDDAPPIPDPVITEEPTGDDDAQ